MPRITLEALKCYETEDTFGGDECRLEVFVDGVLQQPLRNDMNDDQTWELNVSYDFNDRIEVKLWDEDNPDPDDLLGNALIDIGGVDHASASFTDDGANYQLWYSVVAAPWPINLVEQAIAGFEASEQPGVWPNIAKPDLIADIRQIVANPLENVRQENIAFCGPAAVVYELAARQPLRYVQICQELYEQGRFWARTKEICPSATLRESVADLSPANWMLLATLRDAANALFPVEAESSDIAAGLTTPWEMKGWTFELLGFDTVEYTSTYFSGELDAMRVAQRARDSGGVAFLLINAAMIGGDSSPLGLPNHWVSFLGNLQIDDESDHISFDCFSWGQRIPVNLGEEPFEHAMWGVVTGRQ